VNVHQQQAQDVDTVGLILEWAPLKVVPQSQLNALSSHLRDECGWSCWRAVEAISRYRTCERVIRDLMMIGCKDAEA
jgi:hypothetical protein